MYITAAAKHLPVALCHWRRRFMSLRPQKGGGKAEADSFLLHQLLFRSGDKMVVRAGFGSWLSKCSYRSATDMSCSQHCCSGWTSPTVVVLRALDSPRQGTARNPPQSMPWAACIPPAATGAVRWVAGCLQTSGSHTVQCSFWLRGSASRVSLSVREPGLSPHHADTEAQTLITTSSLVFTKPGHYKAPGTTGLWSFLTYSPTDTNRDTSAHTYWKSSAK